MSQRPGFIDLKVSLSSAQNAAGLEVNPDWSKQQNPL
jgi:hypothetical protein